MRDIIIEDERWEGFPIRKVARFLKGGRRLLGQEGRGTRIICKDGKFLRVFIPNNRRIPPLTFRLEEVETEIAVAMLLDTF